jgi:hypothetical protein
MMTVALDFWATEIIPVARLLVPDVTVDAAFQSVERPGARSAQRGVVCSTVADRFSADPPEAVVTSPSASRGAWLVCRRHIDLLRVSSAICRTSC